jgi:hypothetical protein
MDDKKLAKANKLKEKIDYWEKLLSNNGYCLKKMKQWHCENPDEKFGYDQGDMSIALVIAPEGCNAKYLIEYLIDQEDYKQLYIKIAELIEKKYKELVKEYEEL